MGNGKQKNAVVLYALPIMTISFQRDFRRFRPLPAVLLAAAFASLGAVASATQTVAIGEVVVESTGEAAYAEAMRVALVRATGRRAAATDPRFATLVQDARRYVQISRPAFAGNPARITLDAAALERAITALGEPVWSRERPLVLAIVTRPPAGADPALVRQQLERAAAERGLPLQLSSAAAAGLEPGTSASAEAALRAARRAGADAALIGEADGSEWQWSLIDSASVTVFNGDAVAGVEGAADTLALGSLAAVAQPAAEAEVRIVGVNSLKDYAQVRALLESAAAIKSVELVAAEAEGALFRVTVAGGVSGLVSALASQPRLQRDGGRADLPRFRWVP